MQFKSHNVLLVVHIYFFTIKFQYEGTRMKIQKNSSVSLQFIYHWFNVLYEKCDVKKEKGKKNLPKPVDGDTLEPGNIFINFAELCKLKMQMLNASCFNYT